MRIADAFDLKPHLGRRDRGNRDVLAVGQPFVALQLGPFGHDANGGSGLFLQDGPPAVGRGKAARGGARRANDQEPRPFEFLRRQAARKTEYSQQQSGHPGLEGRASFHVFLP
jgi:hypothetical protein